eukprot:scaffold501_cov355-Pinguiococcus_pyrenoidosus.AAC.8
MIGGANDGRQLLEQLRKRVDDAAAVVFGELSLSPATVPPQLAEASRTFFKTYSLPSDTFYMSLERGSYHEPISVSIRQIPEASTLPQKPDPPRGSPRLIQVNPTMEPRSAAEVEGDTVGEVFTVCTTAEGLAVSGYDVTTYFDSEEPVKGDEGIRSEYQGATYLFSTEERKAMFEENPESFAPAFGGFCAKAVSENDVFWVNPKTFIIQDGKLLLFYNDEDKLNTKDMWLDEKLAWGDGTHPDGADAAERLRAAEEFWASGPPAVKQVGGGRQPSEE